MRIVEVGATRRTNLGDYEHNEFSAKAVLDEGEAVGPAVVQLTEFVNWHSRKPVNERFLRQQRDVIVSTDPKVTDDAKARAQAWIDKYEAQRLRIEGEA